MTIEDFKHQILPFKDKLYRFSMRILNNVAEAEDVVQEVFIKIWKDRGNLEQINNLEAWCMRLTKNLSIDKKRGKHSRLQAFPENFDIVQNSASPQKLVELQDAVDSVTQILNGLPEKQKMAIQLRDIEGMSYKEIAEIMQIEVNQVKVNIHRGRMQIRNALIKKESYGL